MSRREPDGGEARRRQSPGVGGQIPPQPPRGHVPIEALKHHAVAHEPQLPEVRSEDKEKMSTPDIIRLADDGRSRKPGRSC